MVLLKISANCAPQHLLLSIPVMVASNRTGLRSHALRQLLLRVLTYIITVALPLVAWLAKMSVTPAKPLSYTATKFAFELNEVFAVLRAILNRYLAAIRTNKFGSIKGSSCVLRLVHSSNTILAPSKVRIFAFEAHKISIYNAGVLFRFSKIGRVFIF